MDLMSMLFGMMIGFLLGGVVSSRIDGKVTIRELAKWLIRKRLLEVDSASTIDLRTWLRERNGHDLSLGSMYVVLDELKKEQAIDCVKIAGGADRGYREKTIWFTREKTLPPLPLTVMVHP